MTTFQIKMIAVITMIIDHIGLFFFPQYEILRYVGRIAFPLFAWLIANGAYHTHNANLYLKRLLILALVSQIPFTLANYHIGYTGLYLNVVFTLFLGLLAIEGIKKVKNPFLSSLIIIGACLLADCIKSDYGAAGVLCVVTFYLFFTKKIHQALSQITLLLIIPIAMILLEISTGKSLSYYYLTSTIEWWGLLALPIIFLYNNKEGPRTKYLFYIFYPVQYIVIVVLQVLLS